MSAWSPFGDGGSQSTLRERWPWIAGIAAGALLAIALGALLLKPSSSSDESPSGTVPPGGGGGGRIAFISDRSGSYQVYVMNADGTGQTRLTNNKSVDSYPRLSRDGSKIVFESRRGGNTDIYSMNADGSDESRLTDTPGEDLIPDW